MKRDLDKAYWEEEVYWKQKSGDKWLLEGDKNTRFFQGSIKRRRIKNNISSLLDENGMERYTKEEKGSIAVKYFQN